MTNIDAWSGPLPQGYIDHQLALQKSILEREREFGMQAVLPAFAGHVPGSLSEINPEAKITRLKEWAGFPREFNTYFLDPEDPLFSEIQKRYLIEQTREFGTDHIYGADPFNELIPPSWEPDYLAQVAATIYNSMTEVDPEARWLQMGWLFYHKSKQWTKPRI
jgi:alpha-N-acetylglucosaminidase